jgi:hypothetical protein
MVLDNANLAVELALYLTKNVKLFLNAGSHAANKRLAAMLADE